MTRQQTEYNIMSSFFSDETERFRTPSQPLPGQRVTIRLRGPVIKGSSVALILEGEQTIPMGSRESGARFSIYEAAFDCPRGPFRYHFLIRYGGRTYLYQRNGARRLDKQDVPDPFFDFHCTPGFRIPAWARGAVQYQIFPDRFCNGDETNDVADREYTYLNHHVRRIRDWYSPPAPDDYRCFYGGDLAGIMQKLDYLQDLGIQVIYLNPIFLSPSSHKYDTQDYEHIDPHLGLICEDADCDPQEWEFHNGFARRYITRVLSEINTSRSDALFASFCQELHRRGMRVILDGVFNHCGSFHRWMDREGIYRGKPGFAPGAFQDKKSPYRDYFRFTDAEPGYDAWWGVETLPKLHYEQSRALCEEIFSVAEKWLKPPYCIDGWRLDVGADLGSDPEFNHAFWKEFRRRVKAVNPDALILAEHYGDPSAWLQGDEWDTVMNYDAFMDPLTHFLTGMEKHSDESREEFYQDGAFFFESIYRAMSSFQWASLECAMNELSNHDHSRFLTRTNRRVGRLQTLGAEAAGKDVDKAVLREAVVVQMTWPGAPTIYYGDEAGLVGWTDPDNRRCYPWGKEDRDLIEMHRRLIALRADHPVLRSGSLIPLGAGRGWISYGRFDETAILIVCCNNLEETQDLSVDIWKTGAEDGSIFTQIFATLETGWSEGAIACPPVEDGLLTLTLPPKSAFILTSHQSVSFRAG